MRRPELKLLDRHLALRDLIIQFGKRRHEQYFQRTLLLFDRPDQDCSLIFEVLESLIAHT